MSTAHTPIYALPYLEQGSPVYEYRQLVEDLAERLETVLALGGAAAPGATDLLTLAGRVGTLETDQAAEDARATPTAVTFGASWAQYATAPFGELVRVWKEETNRVRLQGMVRTIASVAAASTSTVLTVPVGFRPPVQVMRNSGVAVGGSTSVTPALVRADVLTTGEFQIQTVPAIVNGAFMSFDLSWRTTNP